MAKFHKDANIFPGGCDHPLLIDSVKRFFIQSIQDYHSSFVSDTDIAYFAGWLISGLDNADLLDSLHVGIESHMEHVKASKDSSQSVEIPAEKTND